MQDKDILTDPNTNEEGLQRRKLIKTAVIGGGVVGAVGSLPSKWTTPVMNMVATPAHAQTSEPEPEPTIVAGTYSTASPLALTPRSNRSGPQFALLDMLISPANASHITDDFCGTSDDVTSGMSHLYIRVNADMSVNIAIDSIGDGINLRNCEYESPAVSVASDGMSIPEVRVSIEVDEVVVINNMVLSAEGVISGNYIAVDDDNGGCSGAFSAMIGGSYPSMATTCDDD